MKGKPGSSEKFIDGEEEDDYSARGRMNKMFFVRNESYMMRDCFWQE